MLEGGSHKKKIRKTEKRDINFCHREINPPPAKKQLILSTMIKSARTTLLKRPPITCTFFIDHSSGHVYISVPCFWRTPRPPRTSFNQLESKARGQGIEAGTEGAGLGALTRRAAFGRRSGQAWMLSFIKIQNYYIPKQTWPLNVYLFMFEWK